jgi:hypothetical protein
MTSVKAMSPSQLRELLEDPENIALIPDDELDAVLAMLNIDGDHALRTIEDAISAELTRDSLNTATSPGAEINETVQTWAASAINMFCAAQHEALPLTFSTLDNGTEWERLRLLSSCTAGTLNPNSVQSSNLYAAQSQSSNLYWEYAAQSWAANYAMAKKNYAIAKTMAEVFVLSYHDSDHSAVWGGNQNCQTNLVVCGFNGNQNCQTNLVVCDFNGWDFASCPRTYRQKLRHLA